MSKLGFVLRTTDSGEREILHINKDMSWAGYISDTRQYIKALKKFDATGKIIYLLRFLGKRGYLFAIIKARPHGSGKPGDNTSAWIHIPAKSNISIDSLILVIRGVEREISAQDGINEIALKELFSHEYEEKNVLLTAVENIVSNEDGNIGYRYFGKGTGYELEEILGDEIAQIEYKTYRGIFLINSQSEIEPSDQCVLVDKLNSISTITIPKIEKGYVAYINNDVRFSAPIEVPCPYNLNIILKKNGYKDIPISLQVSQSQQIQKDWKISIKSEDCLLCVQKAWFHAYDCENKESLTSNISIKVDGQCINNEIIYVPENLCNHHDVEILCKGYEPYKDSIEISDNVSIGLKAEEHENTFILPKQDGNGLDTDATIIIKTKKKSKSMPLKGYKVSENQLLRYDKGWSLKLKWFGAGVVSVIVLAVLCAICIVLYNLFGTHHKEETAISEYEQIKTHTSVSENVDNIEMDNNKAIEYLNSNSVWAKDSLDNYEITKGLFEAMNELDLDLLTNKKYATLQDQCDNFRSIVNAANTCLDEKIDVQSLIKGRHYNSDPSDKKITVSKYIEWLQDVPNTVVQENITTEKSRITNKPQNNSNKAPSSKSASPNKPNRNGAKVK